MSVTNMWYENDPLELSHYFCQEVMKGKTQLEYSSSNSPGKDQQTMLPLAMAPQQLVYKNLLFMFNPKNAKY